MASCMAPRFLVRFDDLCPTMRWETWDAAEEILDRLGVRPVVAIVPDNRDEVLVIDPPRADFWERARGWKAKGWAIALHGFQHVYDSPHAGLLRLRKKSEFAGVPEGTQAARLDQGLAILRREGLDPDVWIAPGHSFDATTVRLLRERGIRIISDGLFSRVVDHLGSTWVPQQLFGFQEERRGVWTVCYHSNEWSPGDLARFERELTRHLPHVCDLPSVLGDGPAPRMGLTDRLESEARRLALKARHRVWLLRTRKAASPAAPPRTGR